MSSVVHFKFRSSLTSDVIHFDGHEISVKDLKDEIAKVKNLGKFMEEYDLLITSDETNREYKLGEKIQKNSSVVVARTPLARIKKGPKNKIEVSPVKIVDNATALECISKMADVASMNLSEEDKLTTVMDQSTQEFSNTLYNRRKHPTGPPPKNYLCHKCHIPGHYIYDCPMPNKERNRDDYVQRVKMSSGIPRSFLTVVEDINTPGVLVTSTGELVVHKIDAGLHGIKNEVPKVEVSENKNIIPNDWLCPICKEIQTDSVILSCCNKSACDGCVITKLLQSNCPKCPICKKDGVSISNVVQNEKLRKIISDHNNGITKVDNNTDFSNITSTQNSALKIEPVEQIKPKEERSISSSEDELNENKTSAENIAPISNIAPADPIGSFNQIPVRYSAPLSVQSQNFQPTSANHGALIQQGINNLPLNLLLYPGGIHPSYLYQYGAQLGAFPNGMLPFPGMPPVPLSEEQFYKQQKQLKDRNGNDRYRRRSRSPYSPRRNRSPGRRDDEYERRYDTRRSRSRSYERSRDYKISNRQYSPREKSRRSTSRNRRYRTPDSMSPNRSFSPRNNVPDNSYRDSSRRYDSPYKRGRRSITPDRMEARRYSRSPVYRSRSRSRRFDERSMSPPNKRHLIREEPLMKVTKKTVKRVSNEYNRSPSPPLKKCKNSPKVSTSTYDMPRERCLSRSPRGKYYKESRSHSRESAKPSFKVEKRNEKMDDSMKTEKLKIRENRFEKNDLRDIIKDGRMKKECRDKETTRPKDRNNNTEKYATKQESSADSKYCDDKKSRKYDDSKDEKLHSSKDTKRRMDRKDDDIKKEKSSKDAYKMEKPSKDQITDFKPLQTKSTVQKVKKTETIQEKGLPLKDISTKYAEQGVSRTSKSTVTSKKNSEKEFNSKPKNSYVDDDDYRFNVKKDKQFRK